LIEKYHKNGLTSGPFELIEIPFCELPSFSKEEINLLELMNKHRSDYTNGLSIKDMLKIKQEIINSKNRMRINYNLKKLEKLGLINSYTQGNKITSTINELGGVFLETIGRIHKF